MLPLAQQAPKLGASKVVGICQLGNLIIGHTDQLLKTEQLEDLRFPACCPKLQVLDPGCRAYLFIASFCQNVSQVVNNHCGMGRSPLTQLIKLCCTIQAALYTGSSSVEGRTELAPEPTKADQVPDRANSSLRRRSVVFLSWGLLWSFRRGSVGHRAIIKNPSTNPCSPLMRISSLTPRSSSCKELGPWLILACSRCGLPNRCIQHHTTTSRSSDVLVLGCTSEASKTYCEHA